MRLAVPIPIDLVAFGLPPVLETVNTPITIWEGKIYHLFTEHGEHIPDNVFKAYHIAECLAYCLVEPHSLRSEGFRVWIRDQYILKYCAEMEKHGIYKESESPNKISLERGGT